MYLSQKKNIIIIGDEYLKSHPAVYAINKMKNHIIEGFRIV